MKGIKTLALALTLGFCTVVCSQPKVEPQVAFSSSESGYAARYPEALAATRNRFLKQETDTRDALAKFSGYPDELDKPDWAKVNDVYVAADAAGKSGSYVARARENAVVEGFFTDEKEEITKKVSGAAQYAANQKGCKTELYGPTAHALEKSVEKQLEERMRERNEAHAIIDANEEALGKPNREKLEKQADVISNASYLVNVGSVESKVMLRNLIAEASQVKSTLDRTIEEAKAVEADAARKDADKKAAASRRDSAEKAKAQIDNEVQQAEQVEKDMEDRIKALQAEYQKAFDELKAKVAEKQKQAPAPAS